MKRINKAKFISSVIVIALILSLTAPFATASDEVIKELPLEVVFADQRRH